MKMSVLMILPILLVSLSLGAALFEDLSTPVVMESFESKTKDKDPVFNEITIQPGDKKDIWLMAQSHNGIHYSKSKWDQIKIVVDKTTEPYSATYHQVKNGKEIELRAACYICHANGPRAIRPNYESSSVKYSLKDKALIGMMNLRIKTYGRIKMKKSNLILDGRPRQRPLAYDGPKNWQELNIPTCLKCHNDSGFLSRGMLKGQQYGTIEHLTKTGAMPPWPYKLDEEEKKQLAEFISSFK